jgi:hypothetical protein
MLGLGLVLWAAPAAAQTGSSSGPAAAPEEPAETVADLRSQYTDLDLDDCTVAIADDLSVVHACPGYKGIPVTVGERDMRMFVSFGVRPLEEKAAEETLPPANALGDRIEWRLGNESGAWAPKATILRWFTKPRSGTVHGEVLVVTQLKLGATCQIAYIDALAQLDANELARQIADEKAGQFDCATGTAEIVKPFKAW